MVKGVEGLSMSSYGGALFSEAGDDMEEVTRVTRFIAWLVLFCFEPRP
jgi:hypothetical protein